MKICLTSAEEGRSTFLLYSNSLEEHEGHTKALEMNINKNVQLILFFFSKCRKTNQVIIHKGQIISSLSIPNRNNYIKE